MSIEKGRVVVSRDLIKRHLSRSKLLSKAYELLINDVEVRALLRMSNIMAVKRLRYNDHGPVHAMIVAGTALELFERLLAHGVQPTTIRDGVVSDVEHAKLVVMYGALLHDIGNSVHRVNHEMYGAIMAHSILNRVLPEIVENVEEMYSIRQEIMHAVYATAGGVRCLSVEAGVVKIADGLDMAEGRARIPYRLGKIDMHAVSALSIKRVEISEGERRPIRVDVVMSSSAGLFQVEAVLLPKVSTSGLADYLEIYINLNGEAHRVFPS